MASKPATIPTIDSNSTNRSAPPAGKQTDGYVLNDILPSDEYNWVQGFTSDWITWLAERMFDDPSDSTTTLRSRLDGAGEGLRIDSGGFSYVSGGPADDKLFEVGDSGDVSRFSWAYKGTTANIELIVDGSRQLTIVNGGPLSLGSVIADLGTGLGIKVSDVGAITPNVAADDIVIEGDSTGMTFAASATGTSLIAFGDAGNSAQGQISYNHTTDELSLLAGTTVFRVTTSGPVGIGDPDLGLLHVRDADSGASGLAADRSQLVLENNTDCGLYILSGTTDVGQIAFGDSGDADAGAIIYTHTSDTMQFRIAGSERITITSTSMEIDLMVEISPTSSGVTPNAVADTLVVEESVTPGISILFPDTGTGTLWFGSPAVASNAQITFNSPPAVFEIVVAGQTLFGGGAATIGFYGATPISKPVVTGSKAGNAALGSLLTELANLGLLTDSSTG